MDDLKFDKMEADTKLAEDFIHKHKQQLEEYEKESYFGYNGVHRNNLTMRERLAILADKVEENAELFAQLEALKRGHSHDDVKRYDVKAIVQILKYRSTEIVNTQFCYTIHVPLYGDCPLFMLGAGNFTGTYYYDNNTLPCYFLFGQLCAEAGLEIIFRNINRKEGEWSPTCPTWPGCTAVVTERSDIDSAVDTLLASPSRAPWMLRRLYVQESVYVQFKKALSWKCGLKRGTTPTSDGYKAESFIYDDKTFLFDHVDNSVQKKEGQIILVEAFRTVKEVLNLIEKQPPHFVSLWSSDLSESNEIAFNVKAPLVWVNDYGTIDGFDKISNVFINILDSCLFEWEPEPEDEKIYAHWTKMTIKNRIEKFKTVLEEFQSKNADNVNSVKEIIKRLPDLPSNKFVDIEKGKMWVGIEEPAGLVSIRLNDNERETILAIIHSVVNGNWFDIRFPGDILKFLIKKSLPMSYNKYVYGSSVLYKTKCIYFNYGTIFAN